MAVNPASQNWPRDRRGYFSAGKTSHFWAYKGGWENGSGAMCVATIVSPFGMRTHFPPCSTGNLLSRWQEVGIKWLVQPESATSSANGGVTSV